MNQELSQADALLKELDFPTRNRWGKPDVVKMAELANQLQRERDEAIGINRCFKAKVKADALGMPRIQTASEPVTVNGHVITPLVGDPLHKFSIETKRDGIVKFITLKDARRWARLN